MIKPPNKAAEWLGGAAALALLAAIATALIVGIFVLIGWLIGFLAHVQLPALSWPDWAADLFTMQEPGGERRLSAERMGALGTAAFTAVLVYFTATMGLASRRQVAGDAPLLNIKLSLVPPTTDAADAAIKKRELRERGAYRAALESEDVKMFGGAGFNPLQPARMIRMQIDNVQTKPFAVARDIKIAVSLTHRGPGKPPSAIRRKAKIVHLDPRDPSKTEWVHVVERAVEVQLLEPNCGVSEKIFNIAGLNECEIAVTDVTYYELRRRKSRKAAYGDLYLTLRGDGTIEPKEGYYKPRGWEMP